MKRVLWWTAGILTTVVVVGAAAFVFSPWPSVWLIRRAFDAGARQASAALEKHVPTGVRALIDQPYDPSRRDGLLDAFIPEARRPDAPTVVWVHGGGWVSGSKNDVANYAKIVAGLGYTVISIDYTIAPEAHYPVPVQQTLDALAYVTAHAARLGVNPQRLVLAGDSAGAHISAQVANAIVDAPYAAAVGVRSSIDPAHLAGALLFCGPYDVAHVNLDGPFGGFLRTVLWSYSGTKAFQSNARFVTAGVVDYVSPAFPPTFISVGNADPLAPQSTALADALAKQGVRVETLFFPADYAPALGHEYQFNLDTEAGRAALDRLAAFLRTLS